jgi:hypothetical protein
LFGFNWDILTFFVKPFLTDITLRRPLKALLSFRNFSGLVQLLQTGIILVSSLRSVGERVAEQNGKDVSFLSVRHFLK